MPAHPPVGRYIVSPWYDWSFFLLAPLLTAGIGYWSATSGASGLYQVYRDSRGVPQRLFLMAALSNVLTNAHLVLVFARSHANPGVFRLYPWRFTLVPVAIFVASILSQWAFVIGTFVTFWWDVYHSSLQTFGLGRIYDRRAGNDPEVGRTADLLFNLVVYSGPIFAGVNLAWHLSSFDKFRAVDAQALIQFAGLVFERREGLRWVMVAAGVVATSLYVVRYVQLVRQGYRLPLPKVVLFATTAFVSVAVWGFGSFGDSVLIMNAFHALQYFALVLWSEQKNLASFAFGKRSLACAAVVVACLAYGYWRSNPLQSYVPFLALGNVVALMHFWYDGFIWSVRKGQV